jgi:hypothetical protein
MLGFVSGVNQYMLSESSPRAMTTATDQIVMQISSWHGRFLGCYYITPGQDLVQQCLSVAVALWMILLLAGLVLVGIRTERDRGKKN